MFDWPLALHNTTATQKCEFYYMLFSYSLEMDSDMKALGKARGDMKCKTHDTRSQ